MSGVYVERDYPEYGVVHLALDHTAERSARSVSAALAAYARKHYPGATRVLSGGSHDPSRTPPETSGAVYVYDRSARTGPDAPAS